MDINELLCIGRREVEMKLRPLTANVSVIGHVKADRGRQTKPLDIGGSQTGSASSSRRSSPSTSPHTRSILRSKSPSPKFGSPVSGRIVRFREDADGGDSSFTKLHINETTQTDGMVESKPLANDKHGMSTTGLHSNQGSARANVQGGYKPPLIAYKMKGVPSLMAPEGRSRIPVRTSCTKTTNSTTSNDKKTQNIDDGQNIIKNMELLPKKVSTAAQTPTVPDGSKIIQNMTLSKQNDTDKGCQTSGSDDDFEQQLSDEDDMKELNDPKFVDEATQVCDLADTEKPDVPQKQQGVQNNVVDRFRSEATQTGFEDNEHEDIEETIQHQGTQVDFKSNNIGVQTVEIPDGSKIVKNMDYSGHFKQSEARAVKGVESSHHDRSRVSNTLLAGLNMSWSSDDSFTESPMASPRKDPVIIYHQVDRQPGTAVKRDPEYLLDHEEDLINHCAMSLLKREPEREKLFKEDVAKSLTAKRVPPKSTTVAEKQPIMSMSLSRPLNTAGSPQRQLHTSSENKVPFVKSLTQFDGRGSAPRYQTIEEKKEIRPSEIMYRDRSPINSKSKESLEKKKSLSFTPLETYSFKPGSLRAKTPPLQSTPRDISPKNSFIKELDLGPIPKVDKDRQNSYIQTPELSPRERVVKPVQFGTVSLVSEYDQRKRNRSRPYTSPTRQTATSTSRNRHDSSPSVSSRQKDLPSTLLTNNLSQIRATAQRKMQQGSKELLQGFGRSETQVMSQGGERSRPRTKHHPTREDRTDLYQRDVSAERESKDFLYSESLRDKSNERPQGRNHIDKDGGGISAGLKSHLSKTSTYLESIPPSHVGTSHQDRHLIDKKPPLPTKRETSESPIRGAPVSSYRAHTEKTATVSENVVRKHEVPEPDPVVPVQPAKLSIGQAPQGIANKDCVFLDESTILKIIQEAKL